MGGIPRKTKGRLPELENDAGQTVMATVVTKGYQEIGHNEIGRDCAAGEVKISKPRIVTPLEKVFAEFDDRGANV